MFFLLIASTMKEGTAIAKPIQPYNKGITLIQQSAIKAKPTHRPIDVILPEFNLLFSC
jgi:ABC-type thiamine transport system ATPase subunit